MSSSLHIGIDAGSKTVKIVVLDKDRTLLFSLYERHLSNVKETLLYAIQRTSRRFPNAKATIGITGSAGIKVAEQLGLTFTQEVVASKRAVETFVPDADVVIELGGEDSKILFLTGGEELRMNSACAGGTGGFIDTIAGMMDINAEQLNYFAHGCQTLYPIASRCAVFAQSDVRPLLNEGVSKKDIAGSVFRAVALQCVTGLACGRSIQGKIVFLGGPLHFLSTLRQHFREVIGVSQEDTITPLEAHLFVAQGAALSAWQDESFLLDEVAAKIELLDRSVDEGIGRLEPLFESQDEYQQFKKRHARTSIQRAHISSYEGPAYLGIDAGSTSIKCVLVGKDKQILYSYYKRSAGDLIEVAREMLLDLYKHIPRHFDGTPTITIAHSTATGYGEEFLKNAFLIDDGEAETVAHMKAAFEVDPNVDSILDIGGQDIKFIRVRDGQPDEVILNEACSSGCGSLLSGFAWSFNVKIKDFIAQAIAAKAPVDLGTRCTVFMTSRVRNAQKEGATLGDISAGLAYSVVKNALYKVVRMPDIAMMGESIVVQGGTFKNDAVLRAFEKLSGRFVIRPEISEFMGAYGAALFALERSMDDGWSSMLDADQCKALTCKQQTTRCHICSNTCLLTINRFGPDLDGFTRTFVMGNRCEKGAGRKAVIDDLPNLFDYRYQRLFAHYEGYEQQGRRGKVGLLRALSMYEEYPFWFTFFSSLGYEVVLSSPSNRDLYVKGIETIPSESACYPEKISHGHAKDLIEKGAKVIFAPKIFYGFRGVKNCPVYVNYPTALEANIDEFSNGSAMLLTPYIQRLHVDESPVLVDELTHMLAYENDAPTKEEVRDAIKEGFEELLAFKDDLLKMGDQAIHFMQEKGYKGMVLAGRPYHCDPEFNHAIPELLVSYEFVVFTTDSLRMPEDLDYVNQQVCWEHTTTIHRVAELISRREEFEMVQLYSFGCGIDAISTDITRDILRQGGKSFAAIKVDEMSDVATARIRIRSMLAASKEKKQLVSAEHGWTDQEQPQKLSENIFSIQWAQDCFSVIESIVAIRRPGFSIATSQKPDLVQNALSFINNDSCFVSVLAMGEVIAALQGENLDDEHAGVLIPHFCMHCFSCDLKNQIVKVLPPQGQRNLQVYGDFTFFDDLVAELDDTDGTFASELACALVLYDIMNQVVHRISPYIKAVQMDVAGIVKKAIAEGVWLSKSSFRLFVKNIFAGFEEELGSIRRKTQVGITGLFPPVFCNEINDRVDDLLEKEGCEVIVPALTDYFLYTLLVEGRDSALGRGLAYWRTEASLLLQKSSLGFYPAFKDLGEYEPTILNKQDIHGMGWLLSKHVDSFESSKINTVIFAQTFACLPGHCLGRGVFKRIKKRYPELNIISIEYDPGVNGVNRENRVKLLTAIAKGKE